MGRFDAIEERNAEEDKKFCIVLSVYLSGCIGPPNLVLALGFTFIAVSIGLMRHDLSYSCL